jgi:hypothetical protein
MANKDSNKYIRADKHKHTIIDANGSTTDTDADLYGNGYHYIHFDADGHSYTDANSGLDNDTGQGHAADDRGGSGPGQV